MNYTTETNARFVLLHKALCVQHGKNIYLKNKTILGSFGCDNIPGWRRPLPAPCSG